MVPVVALLALGVALEAAGAGAPRRQEARARVRDYATVKAVLKTSQGDVTLRFLNDKAPNTVKAFVDLAASGLYDGTLFHRVIPGFVLQGGDPLTRDPKKTAIWGTGTVTDRSGAPVTIKAELNETTHRRGTVSMAHMQSDPNSASSQFFIVLKDSPFLDRQWTAFAEVESGMEVVDRLVELSNADPTDPLTGGRPRSYQKLQKVEIVSPGEPEPVPKKKTKR